VGTNAANPRTIENNQVVEEHSNSESAGREFNSRVRLQYLLEMFALKNSTEDWSAGVAQCKF
jgi:hypothetical protein